MKGIRNPTGWHQLYIGQAVKVYMGAGWTKGTIAQCTKDSVTIQIDRRTTRCYDLRNIQL